SSSRAIIATDVPGCNNVVEHNYNGLLCKLKDADDLAAKMADMTRLSEDTIKAFGRNGRRKMEAEYSESLVINKYLAALKEYKKAS
ncbi:MAG TPA: glycosyltransferase, partial [Chryseosolibacter sp.]|nr:glycosyltransferase [Chryseosolibacter sp.]